MQISESGLQLIRQCEGYRRFPYKDCAGILTVAFGHKILPDEDFSEGVTQGEADLLLRGDVKEAEAAVTKMVTAPLTQGQFDALVDFAYNLGRGSLKTLLSHGLDQVPAQLPRWNHAGGVEVAGLTKRRAAEINLWNS